MAVSVLGFSENSSLISQLVCDGWGCVCDSSHCWICSGSRLFHTPTCPDSLPHAASSHSLSREGYTHWTRVSCIYHWFYLLNIREMHKDIRLCSWSTTKNIWNLTIIILIYCIMWWICNKNCTFTVAGMNLETEVLRKGFSSQNVQKLHLILTEKWFI